MAFTLAELNNIEAAIASGARTVSYEGKSTTFGSLDEMLRIRNFIMRQLGLAPNASATITVAHDRGYGGFTSGNDSELYTGW
jgi:hypothetical protein